MNTFLTIVLSVIGIFAFSVLCAVTAYGIAKRLFDRADADAYRIFQQGLQRG